MIDAQRREAMIQELMDRSNLMREDAKAAVAICLGESPGDIVSVPAPTSDERRRFGPHIALDAMCKRLLDQTSTSTTAHD